MSIHDDFQKILRKERRKCAHLHQACRATERAMIAAFELGLDTAAMQRGQRPLTEDEL